MRPFALLLALVAATAVAQAPLPPGDPFSRLGAESVDARLGPPMPGELSDSARASLLTMLPGREVYSLFGHSGLRVLDPATGLDRVYNYGTFDFEQPFFIARFVRGQLDYVIDSAPFADEVMRYQYLGRPIIEQPLQLDAATVRALYTRLEVNALPENRSYRYRFFFDNCSTRMLDVLNAALADARHPAVALPAGHAEDSFREMIRPYVVANPALWNGMSLLIGLPSDRVATTRQRTFLPLELARLFDDATVAGRPLVARRDTLFQVPGAGMPRPAFPWLSALLWGVFAVGTVGTVAAWRRPPGRRTRTLDAVLLGVTGLVGALIALLWVGSEHEVIGPNLHLLWAWPTHLLVALPMRRPALGPWLRRYLAVAGAAAAVMAAGWSFWPQGMAPALLPVALLLAVRCLARVWARPVPAAAADPPSAPATAAA